MTQDEVLKVIKKIRKKPVRSQRTRFGYDCNLSAQELEERINALAYMEDLILREKYEN